MEIILFYFESCIGETRRRSFAVCRMDSFKQAMCLAMMRVAKIDFFVFILFNCLRQQISPFSDAFCWKLICCLNQQMTNGWNKWINVRTDGWVSNFRGIYCDFWLVNSWNLRFNNYFEMISMHLFHVWPCKVYKNASVSVILRLNYSSTFGNISKCLLPFKSIGL